MKKLLSLMLTLALSLSLCAPAMAAEPLPSVPAGHTIVKVDSAVTNYGAHHFHDGLMPIYEVTGIDEDGYIESKWSYLSTTGKLVDLGEKASGFDFSEGLAPFLENGLGYIDTAGKVVIPAQFETKSQMGTIFVGRFVGDSTLVFHNEGQDMGSVMPKGHWTQIDRTGKEVPKTLDENAEGVIYSDTAGSYTEVTTQTMNIGGKDYELEFSEGYALVNLAGENTDTMADYQQFYLVKKDGAADTASTVPAAVTAKAGTSNVVLNGKAAAFDAYVIEQANYIKLRDFAKMVSGSGKQFDVTWNGAKNAIELASGKVYTAVGGELTPGDGTDKAATANTSAIYKDGAAIDLKAYTIDRNNYFKLRDLCAAFDIFVGWDGKTGTVSIDTTKGYVAE